MPILSAGWTRLSRAGDKCSARWQHSSGWQLRHCGHPTANWPYFLIDPARPELVIVSFNGRGFKNLEIAQYAIELLAANQIAVTTEDCADGIGRIPLTALGKDAPR
jgi:hypothetical protein